MIPIATQPLRASCGGLMGAKVSAFCFIYLFVCFKCFVYCCGFVFSLTKCRKVEEIELSLIIFLIVLTEVLKV